jgi:hexosaminidase
MYANYRLFKLWDLNARLPNADGLEDVLTNKDSYTQTLNYPLTGARAQYTLSGKLPDTTGLENTYPLTITSPLKDSLLIAVYTTRPASKRILQTASVRHISVEAPATDAAALQPGLGYFAYRTTYGNYPTTDTAKNYMVGALNKGDAIKPFPGQFNTWVKLNGYLKIDTEGDYRITSGFENSPQLQLGNTVIINSGKNKYVEPQSAILHLQKGVYPISGYYLADGQNSQQTLIGISTTDGKQLDAADYLFH